jgi:hypothetical protein
MLEGFWESTFAPDPVTGKPFAVDAIISNPPAFGHVHIAEALGVPLMLSFSEQHSTRRHDLVPNRQLCLGPLLPRSNIRSSTSKRPTRRSR